MFFKNLQIYRLPANWPMSASELNSMLERQAFTPATSAELQRQGWAAPRGAGAPLVHAVGGQFLLQLKTEKKLLPSTVVNQVAAARALEMEEAQGFAPGKKAMKELKERVTDELLPRAFAILSTTAVWVDPVNGWLVVDAASPAKADEVVKLLLKSVDKLPLESLRVMRSPVGAMTEWLKVDESPAGFTVDQDAIMRATGESKAQVAYKRHTLEADDIRRHIAAGKQCTLLAMTWSDKISFVLDESLAIKSVKPLEIIKESATRNDDERFDSDFALMTGELAKMLADLVEALGGEAEEDARPPGPAVDAAPAKGHEPVREQRVMLKLNGQAPGTVPPGDGSATDPMYDQAVELVRSRQRASISLVQRYLGIGYNRAGNLLEAMEALGVVSGMASNGNRTVLAAPGAAA
ncbi:recombination-associated protein RdgC [Janthinobacterium violaceinigrum]|uniref:Recombination-associated protein RdgC n=2 Tax=Janthinobacterium violaceinigrum TaxID=2654252 RepID=A0A6I1I938_9BURK|nr:recombination-associated protein RdgC [Janthinobacterium violaceinigrum]